MHELECTVCIEKRQLTEPLGQLTCNALAILTHSIESCAVILNIFCPLQTCCITYIPIALGDLIIAFKRMQDREHVVMTIIMALQLILVNFVLAVMRSAYFWHAINSGIRLRLACSGLLVNKVSMFKQIFVAVCITLAISFISRESYKVRYVHASLYYNDS